MITRRQFLGTASVASSAFLTARLAANPPAKLGGLKIGVTDWNLKQTGKVDAVALAKSIGFDGVEVSLGRTPLDGKLPLDSIEIQDAYIAAARTHGILLAGTCLDILHTNYLKSDKLGQKWLGDAIPITARLGARVVLMPFFGKGALRTREEMDYVGDVLKDFGRLAQKANIYLGLENTISAEENVRVMDRAGSPAIKVYYDVGSSTEGGFEVVKEIRWLGKERICQMHLKDNPHFLGEGKVHFQEVLQAVLEIGFDGFANLETDCPTHAVSDDMRRNLSFIRALAA